MPGAGVIGVAWRIDGGKAHQLARELRQLVALVLDAGEQPVDQVVIARTGRGPRLALPPAPVNASVNAPVDVPPGLRAPMS